MKVEMLHIMDERDIFHPVDLYKIDGHQVSLEMFDTAEFMLQDIGKFITGDATLAEEDGSEIGVVYYRNEFDIPNPQMHDLFLRICLGDPLK